MKKKIRVGIIFGGRSAEHEVSVISARNVFNALDRSKYEPVPIGITKQGQWCLPGESLLALSGRATYTASLDKAPRPLALAPGRSGGNDVVLSDPKAVEHIDVMFPVLHGTYGEDGTVQGLLRLLDIPFVGADVLGSAIGMDKDVAKRLARDAGIPIAKFITLAGPHDVSYERARKALGAPFFVKPANLGSSVGIHKVKNSRQYRAALDDAFRYDTKVLIEEFIDGREIECSVLGNDDPVASVPGEVVPSTRHEFYSYEAKYLDENGAALVIPAHLSATVSRRVREMAVRIFKVLCLEGMSRVDFFVRGSEVIFNEVNTIPGFTNISMYPKLWEASGIGYAKLLDRLIGLAIERHARKKALKTSFHRP
jgi:D-alanine-D-alanine ligase